MVGRVAIFVPAFLSDWQSSPEDSEGIGESSLSDCSSLALQMWYSQLLTILADYPILLPQYPELLLSPDQKPHPLVLEEKLFLIAWPVSGKVMRYKAFQGELQISSCSPGEITPTPLTVQPGISFIAGVLNETIIPLQHLAMSNVLRFLAEQFDTGLQYRIVN